MTGGDRGQLTADARELAVAFAHGRGIDGLDVIYSGCYMDPSDMALLLRGAADVLVDPANRAMLEDYE